MSALTRALKVNLRVAYLSGRGDEEKVDFVEMNNVPEGQNGMKEVVLLYRCVGAVLIIGVTLMMVVPPPDRGIMISLSIEMRMFERILLDVLLHDGIPSVAFLTNILIDR